MDQDEFLKDRYSQPKVMERAYLRKRFVPLKLPIEMPDLDLGESAEQRLQADKIENLLPDDFRSVVVEFASIANVHLRAATAYVMATTGYVAATTYDVKREGFPATSCASFTVLVEETGKSKTLSIGLATEQATVFQRRQHASREDASWKARFRAWELRVKAHEKELSDASESSDSWVDEHEALLRAEPVQGRKATNFVMNDITWSKVSRNLSTGSPVGGIINDDAKDMLKKLVQWSADLCAVWSGRDINFERMTTGSYHQENPRLALLLAVQPLYWDPFVKAHGEALVRGGLAARMNIVRVPSGEPADE